MYLHLLGLSSSCWDSSPHLWPFFVCDFLGFICSRPPVWTPTVSNGKARGNVPMAAKNNSPLSKSQSGSMWQAKGGAAVKIGYSYNVFNIYPLFALQLWPKVALSARMTSGSIPTIRRATNTGSATMASPT